jgi:hypothetical protein
MTDDRAATTTEDRDPGDRRPRPTADVCPGPAEADS